jgi:hypothetical protein
MFSTVCASNPASHARRHAHVRDHHAVQCVEQARPAARLAGVVLLRGRLPTTLDVSPAWGRLDQPAGPDLPRPAPAHHPRPVRSASRPVQYSDHAPSVTVDENWPILYRTPPKPGPLPAPARAVDPAAPLSALNDPASLPRCGPAGCWARCAGRQQRRHHRPSTKPRARSTKSCAAGTLAYGLSW